MAFPVFMLFFFLALLQYGDYATSFLLQPPVLTATSWSLKRGQGSCSLCMSIGSEAGGPGPGEEGKFVKMSSIGKVFGPKAVIAGGLSFKQLEVVDDLLYGMANALDGEAPLVALTEDHMEMSLENILKNCEEIERDQCSSSSLAFAKMDAPVVVLSGMLHVHVCQFMQEFRTYAPDGFSVAFAQAMPNAMEKRMDQLCGEILSDHAARMEEEAREYKES